MRERLPLPDRIQNAPELFIGSELFYGAFMDLSTCRPAGWGVCPIPFSAIIDYAAAMDIEGDQRDDLVLFVRSLDAAYVKHYNQKEKAKLSKK